METQPTTDQPLLNLTVGTRNGVIYVYEENAIPRLSVTSTRLDTYKEVTDEHLLQLGAAIAAGINDVLARRKAGFGIGERYFGPLMKREPGTEHELVAGLTYRGTISVGNTVIDNNRFHILCDHYSGNHDISAHGWVYVAEFLKAKVQELFFSDEPQAGK